MANCFKGTWAMFFGMLLITSGCASSGGDHNFGARKMDEHRMIPKEEESLAAAVDKVENLANLAPDGQHDDDPDDLEEDEIHQTIVKGIPVELNQHVERWIEYFTVKDRARFERFLERGESFRPMISAILRDQHVPQELFYLALIESGFSTSATSHASAVGVWQFISATGKRYGMKVDSHIDERRDPIRATIAASMYLKDLHNVFNSWYLAMAAYNAGETRIMNSIMKYNSRDFWELVRMDALPRETMNYIPKFLAAVIVGTNREKYGFDHVKGEAWPTLSPVTIPSPVRLSSVAKVTGLSIAALKTYNPHLKKDMTAPSSKTYKIWVPKDSADHVISKSTLLAAHRVRGVRSYSASSSTHYHRVKRGENLALIARKYGSNVSKIKKLNGLRSDRIFAGQRLKVSGRSVAKAKNYRVRRGDSLSAIARKFGVSVSRLKSLNKLKRSTIYAGQVLKVGSSRM